MNPEVIAALFCGVFLSTPIIWILTKHQQKMTQLHHERHHSALPQPEVQREIAELKSIVYQQTIAIDNLTRQVSNGFPERLSEVSQ